MTTFQLSRMFADGELIYRADDDGHTVEGIAVPYHRPADVADEHGRYREVFTPTSFAGWLPTLHRARAEHRIGLNLDHSEAFDHRIGFARTVDETADGVRFTFRLYDDPARIDKVLDMLRSSHRGLSIEAVATKYRTAAGGVREWLGARIVAVAATPKPVHAGAQILAVRADQATELETPRLNAAMARWGITALPSTSDA